MQAARGKLLESPRTKRTRLVLPPVLSGHVLQAAKGKLLEWLKLWEDATAKRRPPPLARLHQVPPPLPPVLMGHVASLTPY